MTAILLGRVLARLRFLPISKNESKNLHQIFKVERSIRNITCVLCAICAKQFARNARICGRTKIDFCTIWTCTQASLRVHEFFTKNNTIMYSQPPYSLDLAPLWLFLVPETEEIHERTTIRYDRGDKDGIEGGAEQDYKKWFIEVLRGLDKTSA